MRLNRSLSELSCNCNRFPNSYGVGGCSAYCRFSEEPIHWRKADLGLLFGIRHKQKQPYLLPLRWIYKWPVKAPISSALRQQRRHWVRHTLLEIPNRCWSLRRRFMQHKPTDTPLTVILLYWLLLSKVDLIKLKLYNLSVHAFISMWSYIW